MAAAAGLFECSSVPGHLTPTAERLESLLSKHKLEELYDVEEQPFARGKYATVRRCRERSSGQQWAAKYLKKRRRAQELRAEALHEVAVLDAAANCPRLVSLHQVFETNTEIVLVLELAPGGELQMVLDSDEILEEREVAKLLRQILDGVAFLHSLNVAHLDIKPQNLVLTGEFPDCDVKLCDFGISRYISQGADIREILGTPDYIAPEVLNYEPISLATDMWSVGVLLYVLLTGCSPFGGDTKQETFCNISRCKLDFPDDLFEDVSQQAQDLIRRLIVKNPSERLSATECLQHPWLSQFEEAEEEKEPQQQQLCVAREEQLADEQEEEEEEVALETRDTASSSGCSSSSLLAGVEPPAVADLSSDDSALGEPEPEEEEEDGGGSREQCEEATWPIGHSENSSSATLANSSSGSSSEPLDSATPEPDESTDGSARPSPSPSPSPELFYTGSRLLNSSLPSQHHFAGLSSERRSNFKRSMDYLAKKFSAGADLFEAFDDAFSELDSSSSRRSSVNATSHTSVSESVFKCTPVFILGEEQQCSDSGSDSVSEISTDSSSDRSSIYSDDSLDFILYGKTSQGRVSFPFSASESHSWKQRNATTSSLRHGPRVWPRECNGVVSKALSRFTTVDQHHQHHQHHLSSATGAASSCKSPLAASGTSTITTSSTSITLTSSSTTRTSTTRSITGLEALRSRGENLVVIREPVRAGRYMRYSEVQCESVQARIRRFQVHGSS